MECTSEQKDTQIVVENLDVSGNQNPEEVVEDNDCDKCSHNSKNNCIVKPAEFVDKTEGRFEDKYDYGQTLGEGAYGQVKEAILKDTGEKRAVKIIKVVGMKLKDQELLKNEIANLRGMDHPNILKMYEFFETATHVYLVTELATGGELFDEIIKRGKLTEQDAQALLKQVLTCINYCHSKNVMHRDLKPENILLEANKHFCEIKIIDFGFSASFGTGRRDFHQQVGTPYYIAPEILAQRYGNECDLWSIGVITYIVLSGVPPFNGFSNEEILAKIRRGNFKFEPVNTWSQISDAAKDFITGLLTSDPSQRPSAQDALNHKWIQEAAHANHADDTVQPEEAQNIIENLQTFAVQNQFRQGCVAFIVSQLLSKKETKEVAKVFKIMDINGDGRLSKDELKQGLQNYYGRELPQDEMESLFKDIDQDENGFIEYGEFVTAAVDLRVLLSKQKLRAVFNELDKDKSNSIDVNEIKSMFKYHDISEQTLQNIMSEYDKNGDGVIQFDEFEDMMIKGFKKKSPALGKRKSGEMEKSDRVTRGSLKRQNTSDEQML